MTVNYSEFSPWKKLIESFEKTAVASAVAILCLSGLSFSLNYKLDSSFQLRFLLSGVVLGLTCIFLRYGLSFIQPVHRASYRIALVMMVWSVGLYFFAHPNFILYLVALPGIYFLVRIEVKRGAAPLEDVIAAGILLALSVFLYLQQQPLQVILFDKSDFDWSVYYINAPCMVMVGLALLRFQYWLRWGGIALSATLIFLLAATLSLSLMFNLRGDFLKDLAILVIASHALLVFVCIPNKTCRRLAVWVGVSQQLNDYRKGVYLLVCTLSQLVILYLMVKVLLLQPYTANAGLPLLNIQVSLIAWLIGILVTNLLLLVYGFRGKSITLLFIELSFITLGIAWCYSEQVGGVASYYIGCFLLLCYMFVICILKKLAVTNMRVGFSLPVSAFISAIFAYSLLFSNTHVFSPVGLLGFILPVLAWSLYPQKPSIPVKNLGFYLWPLAPILLLLCLFDLSLGRLFIFWGGATVIIPLFGTFVSLNRDFISVAEARSWRLAILWKRIYPRFLLIYSLSAIALCVLGFVFHQAALMNAWLEVINLTVCLLGAAIAMLLVAISTKSLKVFFIFELTLWLLLALVRWKLEVNTLLSLGSIVDGYIFLSVAIFVAGVREKARHYSCDLGRYFTRSTLVYCLLGWAYLLFVSIQSNQVYHAEMASLLTAGVLYWLSRQVTNKLQIAVFVFVNIALALFMVDNELNNPLFFVTPVLVSALVLAQLFKRDMSERQVSQIRLYCGLILLASSAGYNLLDFSASIWFPVCAVVMSSLIVVLGISFRVRIFLYLGTAFFFVNIAGMIVNTIVSQPEGRVMFAIGVLLFALGVAFIASYLLFQMKREEILRRYRETVDLLADWDG